MRQSASDFGACDCEPRIFGQRDDQKIGAIPARRRPLRRRLRQEPGNCVPQGWRVEASRRKRPHALPRMQRLSVVAHTGAKRQSHQRYRNRGPQRLAHEPNGWPRRGAGGPQCPANAVNRLFGTYGSSEFRQMPSTQHDCTPGIISTNSGPLGSALCALRRIGYRAFRTRGYPFSRLPHTQQRRGSTVPKLGDRIDPAPYPSGDPRKPRLIRSPVRPDVPPLTAVEMSRRLSLGR